MSDKTGKKKSNALWAMVCKFGAKLMPYFAKLMKAAKFLKFGLAAATFASYAYLFTWKFALLIMIALAWHESGHVWAMKRSGMKTKGFYFLPFIGGAAVAEDHYKTYGQNVYIAAMGPVWGLILAALTAGAYYATGIPMFAAAAGFMALVNLFNLLPVNPLDGGQIVRSIAFSIHKTVGFAFLLMSLVASVVLMYKLRIGLFGFILVIGILDLLSERWQRNGRRKHYDYHMDKSKVYYDEYMTKAAAAMGEGMKNFYTKSAEETKQRHLEYAKHYEAKIPVSMNKKQIVFSIIAYAAITTALIVIMKLMAHVPGAEIAATFMAS